MLSNTLRLLERAQTGLRQRTREQGLQLTRALQVPTRGPDVPLANVDDSRTQRHGKRRSLKDLSPQLQKSTCISSTTRHTFSAGREVK